MLKSDWFKKIHSLDQCYLYFQPSVNYVFAKNRQNYIKFSLEKVL